MPRRHLCLILLAGALASPSIAAPVKPKPSPKKQAVLKPPPAPPKGKATFPKQKRHRPRGKIIKILPGDKWIDPKAVAAAPTAQQVAEKRRAKAVVKLPPKPKKPAPSVKKPG